MLFLFFFFKGGSAFFFEGLCFRIRSKSFLLPDSSFSLINKLKGSVICYTFSFFYNLIFSLRFSFYKKKKFFRKTSKIYYVIRNKSFTVA